MKPLILLAALILIAIVAFAWATGNARPDAGDASVTADAPTEPTASAAPVAAPTPRPSPIAHRPDANPWVASVAEARDGEHPERLSALLTPAPFDPVAYARDPDAYLHTVEPGRIHQTAEPTSDGTPLRLVTEPRPLVAPGGTLAVRVRGVAGAPVSFAAIGGGTFVENGLNSISVRADAEGLATATFRADPGTIGDAPIIAASPLAIGQQTCVVHVGDALALRRGASAVPATDTAPATP